jgi:DNA-binding transcriptional LysR family regulator
MQRNDVDLRSFDLNLLVALDVLLATRHVTRASEALGLTQSATSHALARLRVALGDELLVRGAGGMVLTARAEALVEPVGAALSTLRAALRPPPAFDPATSQRAFSVATSDYVQWVLLPGVVARLQAEAPGVNLWVVAPSPTEIEERLADGTLDLDLTVPRSASPPGIVSRKLFDERFVCIVRNDHPCIGPTLSLEDYTRTPHAFVAPRGKTGGVVDSVLAAHGLSRRVAVAVPHFLIMPSVIASSDLIATLASRVAEGFARHLPLRLLEPPVTLPDFAIHMAWHERFKLDPAHQWLRRVVTEVAQRL